MVYIAEFNFKLSLTIIMRKRIYEIMPNVARGMANIKITDENENLISNLRFDDSEKQLFSRN